MGPTSAARGQEYVLTLSCPDKPGIVYAVSSFLVQHSANILASQRYGESPASSAASPGAEAFHTSWQLHDRAVRIRTLIMVSRLGHCLNDLLFRWKTGSLPVDVAGVVSNHRDFAELAANAGVGDADRQQAGAPGGAETAERGRHAGSAGAQLRGEQLGRVVENTSGAKGKIAK